VKVRWNLSAAGWGIMGDRWTMETTLRQNVEDYEALVKRRTSGRNSIIEAILEAKASFRQAARGSK
jgi:hypothetical protein